MKPKWFYFVKVMFGDAVWRSSWRKKGDEDLGRWDEDEGWVEMWKSVLKCPASEVKGSPWTGLSGSGTTRSTWTDASSAKTTLHQPSSRGGCTISRDIWILNYVLSSARYWTYVPATFLRIFTGLTFDILFSRLILNER